jgi:hypothetical protein
MTLDPGRHDSSGGRALKGLRACERIRVHGSVLATVVLGVSTAGARAASYGSPVHLGHGWHAPWGIAVNSFGDLFGSDTDVNYVVQLPITSG